MNKIIRFTIYILWVSIAFSCDKETKYLDHEIATERYTGKQIEVSEAFIDLAARNVSVAEYSVSNGDVTLNNAGSIKFVQGNIITIDVDTMGYLRKVVSSQISGSQVKLKTEQAFLNEVFTDENFMLKTELIEPLQSTSILKSSYQISSALTDDDGYIHPVEIIYRTNDGASYKRNVLSGLKSDEAESSIISIEEDFTGKDLYGRSTDNIHFYISEGNISFHSDAVFEFDYDFEGVIDENTKFKKGSLKMFKFYFESEAALLTKLKLKMSDGDNKESIKKLLDLKKITAKFMVGAIPVWISFDCDIYGKYNFSCDASLDLDWGFEANHNLVIGGMYTKSTDTFTPIKEYTPINTVYPFNLNGELNLDSRVELYPRIEVKFYDFFGPYAEIAPYVKGYYNSSLEYMDDNGSSETFVVWDLGIDLGMDFRIGSELTFLWGLVNKEMGPDTYSCFETPLWESPQTISLLSTLPAEADANSTHQVKVKVTDNMSLPVSFCPIYFEGDGEFSNNIVLTDINGEASVNWTLNFTEGNNTMNAVLYDSNRLEINKLNKSIYGNGIIATETLKIQPNANEGNDAEVYEPRQSVYNGGIGDNDEIIINYPNYYDSELSYGLIKFPLNQIPKGATIASATIKLYSTSATTCIPCSFLFSESTSNWEESSVTWDTKPEFSLISKIDIMTGGYQWISADVTQTVKGWLSGNPNYGFVLSTDDGWHRFYSSDHVEADKHPILEITYY